jgi:hypothetical protein
VHEVRYYHFSDNLKQKLLEAGYDLSTDSPAEKLAQDMFALNVSAVRQRYEKVGSIPKFTYLQDSLYSLIQTLKSLNCWLYQCCEGDVPKSSLYKLFDDVVAKYFLKRIVYELPEYDTAEWA